MRRCAVVMTKKPRRSIATPGRLGKLRRGTGGQRRARREPRPDSSDATPHDQPAARRVLALVSRGPGTYRGPTHPARRRACAAAAGRHRRTRGAGRLGAGCRRDMAGRAARLPGALCDGEPVHHPATRLAAHSRAPARAHRPRHRGGARFRRGQRRLDDAPHRRTRRASSAAAEPAARESRRPPRAPHGTVRPARRLERAPDPRGRGAPPAGGCTGRPHRSRVRGSSRGPPRRLQRQRGGCRDARSRRGRVPRRLPPGPRFGAGADRLAARRCAGPDGQPAGRLLLARTWPGTRRAREHRGVRPARHGTAWRCPCGRRITTAC